MFDELARGLGLELDSPEQRRADSLVEQDRALLQALIGVRRTRGLTQADVARVLGIKQPSVAAMERADSDPKLSTLRRYAHAVGALVEHQVRVDEQGAVPDAPPAAEVELETSPPTRQLVAYVHSVLGGDGQVRPVYSFALEAEYEVDQQPVDFPRRLRSMPDLKATETLETMWEADVADVAWDDDFADAR